MTHTGRDRTGQAVAQQISLWSQTLQAAFCAVWMRGGPPSRRDRFHTWQHEVCESESTAIIQMEKSDACLRWVCDLRGDLCL